MKIEADDSDSNGCRRERICLGGVSDPYSISEALESENLGELVSARLFEFSP
jgi:hypothetical protein